MTHTPQRADIRGYYTALGIQPPAWAGTNVTVRCFADPEAHAHGDRDPSCSINLTHGAWNCHGCGATGGPYDAAIYQGHTSRSAIDLMICHGLARRRTPASRRRKHGIIRGAYVYARGAPPPVAGFAISEAAVNRWRHALHSDPAIVKRLVRERAWKIETMQELELGLDRGRVTIPVRDHRLRLVGLLRYRPWVRYGQIKMRAAVGSRRGLLPHPGIERSTSIVLVEGEPDMIAARAYGLPAIALPGVDSWKNDWAAMFADRQITIAMDCDQRGRAGAQRIARALADCAVVRIVDLKPSRHDGYDLTDWILDGTPNAATIDLGSPNARPDDGG